MKALVLKCMLPLLFFPAIALASGVNSDHDFQFWAYTSFLNKLNEKTKLNVEVEGRFGDDASIFFFYYFQARMIFTLSRRLDIAPSFRQEFSLDTSEEKWRPLSEPFLDVIFNWKIKKWKLIDRNRIQYRIPETRPNLWQYRNRLQMYTPWKLGKMRFNPIAFDEVFFRETVGFFENRLGIGGGWPLGKKGATTSMFYLIRHRKERDEWRRHHIFWTQFYFFF